MADYFVQRDAHGKVSALYGSPQPAADGTLLTDANALPETHPDIVAYRNPAPILNDYRAAIQAHVDAAAQGRSYDSGVTCASYFGSTNSQWAAEAQVFMAWRDAVWAHAYGELAKVQAGEREQPSVAEILEELPAIGWPV